MRDQERDDALLDHLRQRVGHLRAPTLTRAEHLQAVTLDLALPRLVRPAMHPNVRYAADTFLLAASANSCRR